MEKLKPARRLSEKEAMLLAQVVSQVQLQNVRLQKLAVSSSGTAAELTLLDVLEITQGASYRKDDPHILSVTLDFCVKAGKAGPSRRKAGSSANLTAFIEVTGALELDYQLDFSRVKAEKGLQLFCEINAPFNAWPYLRELVQNITARMGIFPLTLPVYRPTRMRALKFSRGDKER